MKSIHDPRYRQFVERLVFARETAAITQTELAKRLGKHQSFIAKVENLDRRLDVVEVADWLTALGQSPSVFLSDLAWWTVSKP
jgi:transcriptional regulator with XRE-family HTH domain